jgi:hypothetical protein
VHSSVDFFIAAFTFSRYSCPMAEVLLPYAKTSDGKLVEPTAANRNEAYVCLECDRAVKLRAGKVRRKHFCHRVETTCEGESVIHKAAKLKLKEMFEASLNGGDLPVLLMRCARHSSWRRYDPCTKVVEHRFTYPFTDIQEEVTVGSFRLDVALLEAGKVTFGVELYHRHRVPAAKTQGLTLPWVELEAEAVLNDASTLCVLESNLKKTTCRACSRNAGYPFQKQAIPTLPGGLERFPLVESGEALPPELKRCLPPAKIYLGTTLNHLYVLFEESFRYHYTELLHHFTSLKVLVSQVFGSDVPLAVGLLGNDSYTFGVAEFEVSTSLNTASKSQVVSPPVMITGAKHLKVEALKAHVSERLFERLQGCSIFDHHSEKTFWVVAPNREALYWLTIHKDELRGIVWTMYERNGRLQLVTLEEVLEPSAGVRFADH